jgi:hypothetical protein
MFLELTRLENGARLLVAMERIDAVALENDKTVIQVNGGTLHVVEAFSEVRRALDTNAGIVFVKQPPKV